MQRREKHPADLKRLCIGEIRMGRAYAAVAKHRRVKESTIRGWVQRAQAEDAARLAAVAASASAGVPPAAVAAAPVVAKPAAAAPHKALGRCEKERAELRDAVAQLTMDNLALRRRLSE